MRKHQGIEADVLQKLLFFPPTRLVCLLRLSHLPHKFRQLLELHHLASVSDSIGPSIMQGHIKVGYDTKMTFGDRILYLQAGDYIPTPIVLGQV